MIAAVPLEVVALKVLDTVAFDFDPVPPVTPLQSAAQMGSMILHFPVIWLLRSVSLEPFTRSLLFLNGYVELMLLFGAIVLVQRLVIRKIAALK